MTIIPNPCPTWCRYQHPASVPEHGADLGALKLTGDTEIALALHQTGDQEPAVDLFVLTGADVVALALSVPQTRALVTLLSTAVRTLVGAS